MTAYNDRLSRRKRRLGFSLEVVIRDAWQVFLAGKTLRRVNTLRVVTFDTGVEDSHVFFFYMDKLGLVKMISLSLMWA